VSGLDQAEEPGVPDRLHLLRQLDAEGYVEVVRVETGEDEFSPPDTRFYRITEKASRY
jgi:hypothetical protein